jgi:hypothetical protein
MSAALLSVLYSSTAAGSFDDDALRTLLEQSRTNNSRAGITGMLLYRGGRFFQVLEGDEADVRALIERIADDPRHTAMRTLFEEPIEHRTFADWTMGYEPISEPSGPRPDGFRDTFDDLEGDDPSATRRAARELSMWFRVRSGRAATSGH